MGRKASSKITYQTDLMVLMALLVSVWVTRALQALTSFSSGFAMVRPITLLH